MYEDTKKAKFLIEDAIGKEINAFRAPAFSITKENLFAFEVLGELGFTIDCSIFPTTRDYGGMPNYGVSKPHILEYAGYQFKEFPINPAKLIGISKNYGSIKKGKVADLILIDKDINVKSVFLQGELVVEN